MKTRIFFIIISCTCFSFLQAGNLYTSLLEVNDRWAYEKDLPSDILTCAEAKNPVQAHLLRVHQILQSRSTEHLSPELRISRQKSLNILRAYALAGEFPNNLLHKERRPVFIAPNGNYCAVGYLIKRSGRDDLARKISYNMNYEYLLNMKDDDLQAWVKQSGFTAEELAWIQPAYSVKAPMVKMGKGVDGPVQAILPAAAPGEIIAAGSFQNAGDMSAAAIARWFSGVSGFGWTGLGASGIDYEVKDMIYYEGGMVVAGNIAQADTVSLMSGVASWDGDSWTGMGEFYTGAMVNTVWDLEIYNGELYAGGHFKSVPSSGTFFTNLARWNGSDWESVGGFIDGTVRSLHVHDGKLIVAGDFTTIDTVSYDHIAAYDGNSFSTLGSGISLPVYALESVGDTLFAGGEFTTTSSTDTFGLGYFYSNSWHRVPFYYYPGSLSSQRVECMENTPYGLFIGGDLEYLSVLDIGRNLLRYADGTLYAYAVLDSTVHSLNYDPNVSQLYIGGDFVSGQPQSDSLNHITYVDLSRQFSTGESRMPFSSLYPNPAESSFSLKFEQAADINSFNLHDITGREFSLEVERVSPLLFQFSLQNKLPAGVYVLSGQTNKGLVQKRIVIR